MDVETGNKLRFGFPLPADRRIHDLQKAAEFPPRNHEVCDLAGAGHLGVVGGGIKKLRSLGGVIAPRASREEVKRRLLTDPAGVLREHGLAFSPDAQIKVMENTGKVYHLILPSRPGEGELSEEQLAQVAAGKGSAVVLPPPVR